MLKIYGITEDFFLDTIPDKLKNKESSENYWITLISYVFISIQYSE